MSKADYYITDERGLRAERVGEWAEAKYDLVEYYTNMFTTSMRNKWGHLVYLDLFCGPGRAQLGDGPLVDSSPSIALGLKHPFTRYVFCDVQPENISALRERVELDHPTLDARFVAGDANAKISQILEELPRFGKGKQNSMLSFCLLDPYRMRSLKFQTIRRLASLFIDILILVPTYMEANRDWKSYQRVGNRVVADFIGRDDWRTDWEKLEARRGRGAFGRFVRTQFVASMTQLGFTLGAQRVVRYEHRVKLYHLLGFSRNVRGLDFWQIAEKRTDPVRQTGQLSLFGDDN